MPAIKRKLVVLPQDTVNKKLRPSTAKLRPKANLTVTTKPAPPARTVSKKLATAPFPSSTSESSLSPALSIPISNHRFDEGQYPWDDYQDGVFVKSIELDVDHDEELTGTAHYLDEIEEHEGKYAQICTDFNEYCMNGKHLQDIDELEDEDEEEALIEGNGSGFTELLKVADDYDGPIYSAKTKNPAVFLAITRIAQRNLPFLDFTSGLTHLPNLPPTARLPKLLKGVFIDQHPHARRASDIELTVAFLRNFYDSPSHPHALGYFSTIRLIASSTDTPRIHAESCLFTPCSGDDLLEFDMIAWSKKKLIGRPRKMEAIGSHNGAWLKPDIVEGWKEWEVCRRVVGEVWVKRVEGYCAKD
jgi:hypothetical protein